MLKESRTLDSRRESARVDAKREAATSAMLANSKLNWPTIESVMKFEFLAL